MPFLAAIPLATLATVAGAGIGATELGMGLAGVGQPSAGAAKDAAAKQAQADALKQAQADAQNRQKAILGNLPNAQEQGGGALGGLSLTDLASVMAGLPGATNTGQGRGALSTFLGSPQTTTSTQPDNLVSATYGLSGSQQ
jgi:hypothetical protein